MSASADSLVRSAYILWREDFAPLAGLLDRPIDIHQIHEGNLRVLDNDGEIFNLDSG